MFDSSRRDTVRRIAAIVAICVLVFAIGWLPLQFSNGEGGDEPPLGAGGSATVATSSVATGTTATTSAMVAAVPQTPLPEETQAIPGQCGQAVVSGVDALAIRDAPGLDTERIGSRPSGTVVELLCDAPVEADGVTWRKVRTAGVEGWMSGGFLR